MDKLRRHTYIERGQGLVEYVILLVLVAMLVISILSLLGPAIGEVLSEVAIVLQNPQDYTKIIATRDAEIAATQDAEVVATQEAEAVAIQDAPVITSVSAKREGDASLKIYVAVSKPTALAVVTSDGRSASTWCVQSCMITIAGMNGSFGTVTVTPFEGNPVSVRYPSRIVSKVLQPESIATAAGTVSGLALALYFGKSLWWKVGLKVASQCAASGKTDMALRIFQRVITSGKVSSAKASGGWNLIGRSLIKNTPSAKLLNFYQVERGVVKLLPPVERLEFFTKMGGLSSKLGSFDSALPAFKSAEQLLYSGGVESASPAVQAALFGGLGTIYIRTGDDTSTLRMGNRQLDMAQESVSKIVDGETRRSVQEVIDGGREQTGQKLPLTRRKEKAWGGATIDDCEEDDLLYVGKTYILTTSMGWGDAPATAQKAAFTEFRVPQLLESFAFDVSVWAEDMDVCAEDMDTEPESPWMRTLELDPASDSPTHVQFKLTPKSVGRKAIRIDFYYKLHWLQQVTFRVEVMEPPSIAFDTIEGDLVGVQPLQVRMLLGLGGRGDKSFNDSAYQGLETARQLYGIEFETTDSSTLEESVNTLQQWAEADYDLIIAIGYHNGPAIAQVAESFPEKRFVIIDTKVEGENIWSAVFREYEADYVVGALAALITGKGGRVGFIGGVRTPVICRIESVFSQGIGSVIPDAVLDAVYVDRFDDQVMGEYLAEMLYAKGVKVIYQAAGGSGIGAIHAAKKLGKLIISTGGDHSELAPDAVLTSRIKNVYRPVLDVVKAAVEGQFEGGETASYGLADGGLLLTPIRPEVVKRLIEWLPSNVNLQDLGRRMQEIQEAVTSGQIIVDLDEAEEIVSKSLDGKSLDDKGREYLTSGWDLLLVAALEVGVELLAESGFGDQVHELKEQLADHTKRDHWAACNRALDQAVKDIGDERMRLLLNHRPFRDAVVTGLLDPVQGFDLQAAAKVWGNQLLILAPILRRFFSVLESALLADETLGALLAHYRSLRYRQDVLEAMRELRLDVPSQELVSMMEELLIASGAIAQNGSMDTDASGVSITEDELANVVQAAVQRLVTERVKVTVPEPRSSTAIYIVARVEAHSDAEPLYLGNKYYLRACVSRTPIEGFECVDVLLLSGESTFEFDVVVQAADVDVVIEPAEPQRFVWQYEEREAQLLEYVLTPLAVGRREIQVEFYWRQHRLTQIKFDANVVAAKKPRIQAAVQLPPSGYQDYPIDIHLLINREGARYRADILALGRSQRVPIKMSPQDLLTLNEQLREMMETIASENAEREGLTAAGLEEQLRPLAEIGHYAFKQVFSHPNALVAIRELLALSQRVSIQVSSEDFFLPWELIYPIGLDETLSYGHFWGMNYIISRAIEARFVSPIIPIARRPSLGLMTDGELPSATKVISFFDKLADDGQIILSKLRALDPDKKQEEFKEFKAFWEQTLNLAHFACHASYKDEAPNMSRIMLSDKFPVTLMDMEVHGVVTNGHPLVIMNACETGNLNPLYTSHFAAAFLKYGARGVVATECAVPDSFAADFTQQLYTHLLAGKQLGESLLTTRRYFWEKYRNPSGLLYSMYAPPSIRLVQTGE